MRVAARACLILLLVGGLAGCKTISVSGSNFFHPGYAAMASKVLPKIEAHGYTATSLFFRAKDGTRLHGLLLTRPGNRVTVLAYNISTFQLGTSGVDEARVVEKAGVNAFLVEYRGYGQSEGTPAFATLRSDGVAAFDFVRGLKQLKGQPIVVYGVSLGSFVAPYVALHRPVGGMVLSSTATDVSAWVSSLVPWYAKPFVRFDIAPILYSFDNAKSLARYHGPLLLLAGGKDTLTAPKFARQLYALAATPPDRKMFYEAPDEGHAQVLGDPEALAMLDRFINLDVLHGRPGPDQTARSTDAAD